MSKRSCKILKFEKAGVSREILQLAGLLFLPKQAASAIERILRKVLVFCFLEFGPHQDAQDASAYCRL